MSLQFIRQVDELGRIVIPKDFRKRYGFKPGDEVYLEAYDNGILIHNKGYYYEGDEQNNEEK